MGGTLTPGPTLPDTFKPSVVSLAGLAVGAAQMLGGPVMGRVTDRLGVRYTVLMTVGLHGAAYSMLAWIFVYNEGHGDSCVGLGLVAGFLLGAGDIAINTAVGPPASHYD
jgi:predicted MFS family arabinose efflux permease